MSGLNQNDTERILPILKLLVQAIKKRGSISEKQLNIFMENIETSNFESVKKEIFKWSDLLTKFYQTKDEEEREAIEMTLEARGIPQANLTLALSELDKKESIISEPLKPLSVSVNVLNFAQLQPGEQKELSFFVEGGPGYIENSIQYLKISKTTFGVDKEGIKAIMFGGNEGEQIADSIYFRTNNEVKEVTVIADWKESEKRGSNISEYKPLNEVLGIQTVELKNEEYVECPYCSEKIKKKAIICRFCNREVFLSTSFLSSTIDNLVLVTRGSFWMGDTFGDGIDNEKPVNKVTLTYDFYIGKYPVTQKEYYTVMLVNPSSFEGEYLPVDSISWSKAIEFCNIKSLNEKLPIAYNDKTGELLDSNGKVTNDLTKVKGYRLPTEAEWEYVAKGGIKTKGFKYSGNDNVDEVAWYENNSFQKTHPVGTKKTNELGIFDMSGNVYEWCQDWYDENYYSLSTEQLNPYVFEKKLYRVLRGGSWTSDFYNVRISYRYGHLPDYYCSEFGFRIVRTVV